MKCARAASLSLAVGPVWASATEEMAMTAARTRITPILNRTALQTLVTAPAQLVGTDAVPRGGAVAAEVALQHRRLGAGAAAVTVGRRRRRTLGQVVAAAVPQAADACAIGEVVGIAEVAQPATAHIGRA